MTSLEMEMRVREHQQRMLKVGENNRLLSLAARPPALRVRLAKILLALVERLDPQARRAHSPIPCPEC
jgi:hypothetical protein